VDSEELAVGLCFTCRHSQIVPSRHARYWLCRLAAVDPRFDKYPRLPVVACSGYEPRPDAPETPASEG
jgi:hypothetical protein